MDYIYMDYPSLTVNSRMLDNDGFIIDIVRDIPKFKIAEINTYKLELEMDRNLTASFLPNSIIQIRNRSLETSIQNPIVNVSFKNLQNNHRLVFSQSAEPNKFTYLTCYIDSIFWYGTFKFDYIKIPTFDVSLNSHSITNSNGSNVFVY
jgi:hypothetical protein